MDILKGIGALTVIVVGLVGFLAGTVFVGVFLVRLLWRVASAAWNLL